MSVLGLHGPDSRPGRREFAAAHLRPSGELAPAFDLELSAWQALFQPSVAAPPAGEATGPDTERSRLGALAAWRWVSAESLAFECQAQSEGMIALCEGDVALGLRRSSGEFRVDRHVSGPAWLEVSAGWLGGRQAQDALALSGALLMVLSRQAIAAWAGGNAALWSLLGSVLARELADAGSRNQDLMHKDAGARLATWLTDRARAERPEASKPTVVLPTVKRDLASQLAITPETLSRLMRRFSEQGLIRVSAYTVHLLDPAGLRRCAQAAP